MMPIYHRRRDVARNVFPYALSLYTLSLYTRGYSIDIKIIYSILIEY